MKEASATKGRYPRALSFSTLFAFLLPGALGVLIPLPATSHDQILPLKIKVSEKAPDFALPSADGKTVRLSDYAGHNHNVLIDFYRGYWRPYCMGELGELVKHYSEFKALDVQVLALSVGGLTLSLGN